MHNLQRFIDAQETAYSQALLEIRQGRKQTHWMWFIFPQLTALGRSETARFYGISDLDEASAYLKHPVLGPRLIGISRELLALGDKTAHAIMGSPDDLKLHSCMTLFSLASNTDTVFEKVLVKYFNGSPDVNTLQLISA